MKLFVKPKHRLDLIISIAVLDLEHCQIRVRKINGVCLVIINQILPKCYFEVSDKAGSGADLMLLFRQVFSTPYFEGRSGSRTLTSAVTFQSEGSSLSAAAGCAHHAGGICAGWLSFKGLQRLTAADPEVQTTSEPQKKKSDLFFCSSLAETDFRTRIPGWNSVAELR